MNGKTDAVAKALDDLAAGRRINRSIPGVGRLLVDHHLPFLILHRSFGEEDEGTAQLATTEASFLTSVEPQRHQRPVRDLIRMISELSVQTFGTFLLVEVWARRPGQEAIAGSEEGVRRPGFRLFCAPESQAADAIVDRLQRRLRDKKVGGYRIHIDIPQHQSIHKNRPSFVLGKGSPGVIQIGLEVEPCYRAPESGVLFPIVVKSLRSTLSKALRYALYHYIRQETPQRPHNFNVLGRQKPAKVVWEIDARLDRISSGFDFLLSVNPINAKALWAEFRRSGYESLPAIRYRPLQIDVSEAKRTLFNVPIEKVEDPSLGHLFIEKQEELDRQLTMLKDRGTSRFLLGSHQLYGRITSSLVREAEEILERVHASTKRGAAGPIYTAKEFGDVARKEIAHYQQFLTEQVPPIEYSNELMVGMMVSSGKLLLRPDVKMPANRAQALIQHEIGTHLLTWLNGRAQPLTQLRSGLAYYEELQEGLAVLAEYLVGGLTPLRLRTLAARVLAAKAVLDGATFVDTFRFLCRYGFKAEQSFNIALRIYRGGGYTKDAIYLRGFGKVLKYINEQKDLDKLYVGKIALKHVSIVEELQARKVVQPPLLRPRYLDDEKSKERLERLRNEVAIYDLVNG